MVRTRGRGSRGIISHRTNDRGSGGRGSGGRSLQDSIGVQRQSDIPIAETHESRPSTSRPSDDVVGTSSFRSGTSCSRLDSNEPSRLPVDLREEIWIERPGMKRFRPSMITNKIMKQIINRMPCFSPTWKEYPSEMKDILYTEFKAKYKFKYPEEEVLGRSVWDTTCRERYSDNICNIRKEGLRDNNTEDIIQIRNKPPRGIRVDVWNQFVDYWHSEKFQKRSISAKANRSALPDAAVHTGGSVSFGVTKERMEKEKGGSVSMRDLYERTHKKRGTGEYVSQHAQEFVEKLDAGLERVYGDDPSQYPIFDHAIWMEAARHNKKGRVEGIGRSIPLEIDSCTSDAGPSDSQPTPLNRSEYQELKQDIHKISDTVQQFISSIGPLLSRLASSSTQQDPTRDGGDDDIARVD